jgi:tRNA(fMet)-specific endonuclease VapC
MSKDTFVLDTNILVAAVRNSPVWQNIKATQELSPENSYISVVSEAEIFSLAAQFKWRNDKIEKLQTFLDTLNIIPINNPQLVKAYVAIDVYSQKLADVPYPPNFTPRNMGKNDIWIAATAVVTNSKLISTDADFLHLDRIFLDFVMITV